jgi:hypothetical protein
MSNELVYSGNTVLETGLTVKARLYKDNIFVQDVNCTELPASSAVYYGSMTGIPAGTYVIVFIYDTNSYLGSGSIEWNGTIEVTPATLPAIEALDVDGITMQDTLKYLLATITGTTLGAGTAENKFYDPTGTTVRVDTEFNIVGDRHSVTLNPN